MKEAFSLKRIGIALAIAAGIYGFAAGTGAILYATDTIGTGATHNDCVDYRDEIAAEQGIDPEDVEQSAIKSRTQACLATHEQTAQDAFRSEFLFWSIWPGVICALVFLIWPVWTRVLLRQEEHEDNGQPGGERRTANQA